MDTPKENKSGEAFEELGARGGAKRKKAWPLAEVAAQMRGCSLGSQTRGCPSLRPFPPSVENHWKWFPLEKIGQFVCLLYQGILAICFPCWETKQGKELQSQPKELPLSTWEDLLIKGMES